MTVVEDPNDDDLDEASRGIEPNDTPFPFVVLEPVDEAAEGVRPQNGPTLTAYPKEERQRHADNTRRSLAFLIIGVVLALDCVLVVSFVWATFHGGNFSKDDFSQAVTNLAGPNALAAAVIGFYYGKTSDSE